MIPTKWDVEADVVGFGGAGFATSVATNDTGAKIVILEKAPEGRHGGNMRVAAQGYPNTSSADRATIYLKALCDPYTVPEASVWRSGEYRDATQRGVGLDVMRPAERPKLKAYKPHETL